MYIYMYMYVYVCMFIFIYMYMYVCMYVCMYVYMYIMYTCGSPRSCAQDDSVFCFFVADSRACSSSCGGLRGVCSISALSYVCV